jgi:hypothetical protein
MLCRPFLIALHAMDPRTAVLFRIDLDQTMRAPLGHGTFPVDVGLRGWTPGVSIVTLGLATTLVVDDSFEVVE